MVDFLYKYFILRWQPYQIVFTLCVCLWLCLFVSLFLFFSVSLFAFFFLDRAWGLRLTLEHFSLVTLTTHQASVILSSQNFAQIIAPHYTCFFMGSQKLNLAPFPLIARISWTESSTTQKHNLNFMSCNNVNG